MDAPRVTILTPTLNAEQYFDDCLTSIRAQTYPAHRLQHLILDSGSTDRTLSIAGTRSKTSEVRIIPGASIYEALNTGIEIAEGEIIAWLNADDWFYPSAIDDAVRALAEAPRAGAAISDIEVEHVERRQIEYQRMSEDPLVRVREGRWRGAWVHPIAVFFRRSILESLAGYNVEYQIASDLDLWFRAASRDPPLETTHTNSCAGRIRIHRGSLSGGRTRAVNMRECIELTKRWSLDRKSSDGVRRCALAHHRDHLLRLAILELSERRSGIGAALPEVIDLMLHLERMGPGLMDDISPVLRKCCWEAMMHFSSTRSAWRGFEALRNHQRRRRWPFVR